MVDDDLLYDEFCRLHGRAVIQAVMPRMSEAANDEKISFALPGGRLVLDTLKIAGGCR